MLNCICKTTGRYSRRGALILAVALLMLPALLLTGCGTNRNTALSRQWQAFNTRYNVYYNGSEHYKEQLKAMEQNYQDDYTRQVLMHPAEARADEKRPQPSGDFKRTIEKMQKAIQLHSISKKPKKKSSSPKDKAFRAREEFNPFLHNAWLMMARAQYYNGDFLGAASTFLYIQRHYKWNPRIVAEAQLWQALSYCAMDWVYEAENILVHIHRDKLPTKSLQRFYDFVEADYLIRADRKKEAVPYLEMAARNASGAQKHRLYFLLGQILAEQKDNKAAYEAFGKAGSGAGTSYLTKFNARIKQSELFTGTNIKKEVNALRSMARYGRNAELLDQIYYAIGNLYLSRNDTVNAEKNYRTAIEKSTRNGIDKALAQLALGNLLFLQRDYVGAQPCYSEAVPQLSDSYPDYKKIKLRSDVLDELAEYAANVHLQDSLLTLSKMSEEDQRKACRKLADDYAKKLKEEEENAKREEALANAAAQGSQINNANAPTQYQLNTDKSWYFYNTMTKNAGRTEFQRRWGSRKNEDNWRRRNKNTFSLGGETDSEIDSETGAEGAQGAPQDSTQTKEQLEALNDPTKAEYYLKDIPATDAEIAQCNDIIQEGLFNMGVILKDKLEDFAQARRMFNELLERYPDNVYRLDVYYNMYLMAVRRDERSEAEKWRKLIVSDFPESNYGQALRDPNFFDNLRRMDQVQESIYDRAYTAYLDNDNATVHSLTAQMEKDYPLSKILPKFIFIDALSYVTDRNEDKFKERLEELLRRYPDTDITPTASAMLNYARSGRKLSESSGNSRGMLWETRLIADGEEGAQLDENGTPLNFDLDPNKPQLLVLAFPLDSVNPNQMLYEVARHNFSSFVVKDFDLEPMNFGNIGLLVVKGFSNMKELEHYRSVMESDRNLKLPPQVRPIMISDENFKLLLRNGRSFEEYFDFEAREKERLTEEKTVGPDNYVPGGPNDPDNPGAGEVVPDELLEQEEAVQEAAEEAEEGENSEATEPAEEGEESSETTEATEPAEEGESSEGSETEQEKETNE